jgi:hypothetical protein
MLGILTYMEYVAVPVFLLPSVVSSAICRRPLALAAHGVVASLAHALGMGCGSRLALYAEGGAVMRHLTLDTTLA